MPELVVKIDDRVLVIDLRRNDITDDGLLEMVQVLSAGGQSVCTQEVMTAVEQAAVRVKKLYQPIQEQTNPAELPERMNFCEELDPTQTLIEQVEAIPSRTRVPGGGGGRKPHFQQQKNPHRRPQRSSNAEDPARKPKSRYRLQNGRALLSKMNKSSSTPFLASPNFRTSRPNGRFARGSDASNFNPMRRAVNESHKDKDVAPDLSIEGSNQPYEIDPDNEEVDVTSREFLYQRMVALSNDDDTENGSGLGSKTSKKMPKKKSNNAWIDSSSPLAGPAGFGETTQITAPLIKNYT